VLLHCLLTHEVRLRHAHFLYLIYSVALISTFYIGMYVDIL